MLFVATAERIEVTKPVVGEDMLDERKAYVGVDGCGGYVWARDIRFEQVSKPACPEGGFVVKVEAVGLCGSDIRNLTTDSTNGDYPFIYGHEVVGRVHEVAPGVDKYRVGQMIYVYPEAHCLKCDYCRAGFSNQCLDVESYTSRPRGFAQYISYTRKRVERGQPSLFLRV